MNTPPQSTAKTFLDEISNGVSKVFGDSNTPTGPFGRKLSEDAPESDRAVFEFAPEANLQYKVDEDLIHGLLRRQAFRGVEDGREAELGEATITHFRLHKGDEKPREDDSDFIAVGPEEKFEADISGTARFSIEQPRVNIAMPTFVAGVTVLGISALAAGIYRVTKRTGQVLPYVTVEEVRPQE